MKTNIVALIASLDREERDSWTEVSIPDLIRVPGRFKRGTKNRTSPIIFNFTTCTWARNAAGIRINLDYPDNDTAKSRQDHEAEPSSTTGNTIPFVVGPRGEKTAVGWSPLTWKQKEKAKITIQFWDMVEKYA